jgi:alpha-tubulin suppressor-like RCC1 family protein
MWPSSKTKYVLYSWGGDKYNILGNTTNNDNPLATSIQNYIPAVVTHEPAAWSAFSSGTHALAVKTDGTLWSWGRNNYGQLGTSTKTTYGSSGYPSYLLTYTSNLNMSSPTQVGALSTWASVSAGYLSSAAVKTDGTLWTWGLGTFGRLGLGNTATYSSPKQVGALTNWSKVSMGDGVCGAIKTDGTLWTWGSGSQGALGSGATADRSSPVQVGALTTWATIVMAASKLDGRNFALATKTDGTLWSWGSGGNGVLGLGNTTSYSSPKQVGALTTWRSVACTSSPQSRSVIAVKTDGTLWSWGYNSVGQLGLNNLTAYSSPKQVGALTTWSKASITRGHALATKTDGTLWAWGAGTNGKLGLDNTTTYSSPKQVGTSTAWTIPVASVSASFALKG